jgi:hypothetical protein
MLDPQIAVNLLLEFGVCVDIGRDMTISLGIRFKIGAGGIRRSASRNTANSALRVKSRR